MGLGVHKETIDVSIAEGHRNGDVRHYGVIASDLEPLDKVVRALRAHYRLHFVYEAGPCGFGIYRHRAKLRRIDLHWHDLRHEGASRLLADGVDIRIIHLMLGHASVQQTQR